jgi:hypothetical protein
MPAPQKFIVDPEQFVSSLRTAIEAGGLEADHLSVAAPVEQYRDRLDIKDRHEVTVTDGHLLTSWRVASLQELFRGNEEPPPDIDKYPEDYVPLFWFVEKHVVAMAHLADVPTDAQFEEWYSNLRRRPDGRSLAPFHDYLWQVAALLLGIYPLSRAQFEGLFGALARSASTWRMGYSSRNYVQYLRRNFG